MTTPPRPSARTPDAFDVCGALPSGLTLLEASAGTGKTFTIAALVARYVAEGLPLERLLVITFTRAATGELRTRVRERLVAARDGLDRVLAGEERPPDDALVHHLSEADPATVRERRERLGRAVAQFDAATIETTHGFCRRVLTELGVASDVPRSAVLVEDARDLLEEVVDDLYVRRFAPRGDPPPLGRREALGVARAVLDHPSARLEPPWGDGADVASLRGRLAEAVRREVDRRSRAAGLLTYDDVLVRLRDTLASPERGPAARTRLRRRYEVVLIDEFQDTDPIQWEIVERAFGEGGTALVLIGDPKQAIYAFRGADVQAYLDAARAATAVATLGTNWRSDRPLLDALDVLFGDSQLGDADIVYRQVAAAERNAAARLSGAPVAAALRLRQVSRDAVERTSRNYAQTDAARRYVARDLAADVASLLASGAEVELESDGDGGGARREPIRPAHLAVLVRTNSEASLVRDALQASRVPAVLAGTGNVFATTPALEWLRLLEALEQPTSRSRAAGVALTCFIGWDARRLALAEDDELDELHGRLQAYAGLLRERGVAALFASVSGETRLPARLLAEASGERLLTDLRHVAELLHAQAERFGLGPAALGAWLRERIADAADDAASEERSRRLESDAEAVQVLTIHRSKGLEFPVVYCPFLWGANSRRPELPVFHDPAAGGARTLDVGGNRPGFAGRQRLALAEAAAEDLRLAYVALTRARHQVVVWWAPSQAAGRSPLGRILLARDPTGAVGEGVATPGDDEVLARLRELSAQAAGSIAVEAAVPAGASYRPVRAAAGVLALARLDRALDTAWRRVSYTSLTAASHDDDGPDAPLGDEALSGGAPVTGDEGADAHAGERLRRIPASFGEAPGGAALGTLVHRVLERTELDADDLPAALRSAVDAELALRRLEVGDRAHLVAGLAAAIETPLGPSLGERRLRDLSRADRLDELGFELPLVGGDRPVADLPLAAVATLLREALPAGDPVAAYAGRLEDPAIQGSLRGYLTGSLDLVLRTPEGRFAVCDYKTNRLADGEGALTAFDYRPAALEVEMARCHYPLQALLYLVALHRYLRWRLRGYEPERHLAGAHYLFLRGMVGDADARVGSRPCGVWSWQPPAAFVESLSALLDEGVAAS